MCGQHRMVLAILLWITGTLHVTGSFGKELLLTTIDRCGEAPLIENGDIVERSRVQLKYQCRPGYTLQSDDSVLCFANSSWSELPRCVVTEEELLLTTIDRCGEAPLIDNGDIMERGRVQLKYQCRAGYTLLGDDTVLCFISGSWSELPHCKENSSCIDPEIANANYTKFQFVRNNEKIWIRCNTGYEDKNKRGIALCQNGEWTVLPICEKIESWCGPPPQVPNAVIINQVYKDLFPEDEIVEYVCDSGFELMTNNNKAYCSYGQWLTPPSCRAKPTTATAAPISSRSDSDIQPVFTTIDECGTPPVVMNGEPYYDKNNMFVTYNCNYLYQLKGSRIVRCANGHWTREPTCEVNFCQLDASRYHQLESNNVFYIQSGTYIKLDCLDSTWRTARAVCRDKQLYLSKCCMKITHGAKNCEYVQIASQ